MKHPQKHLSSMLLFILGVTVIQAQESFNTSGGSGLGSGGTATYSLGQVVFTTNTGTSGSLAQGVQQPFEISVVTAIDEAKAINLKVSVYPNPTTDYLTLEVKDFDFSNLSFELYDMSGKLLQIEKIADNQTSIGIKNLVPATYFVKVTDGNKEIKTFKIIKN